MILPSRSASGRAILACLIRGPRAAPALVLILFLAQIARADFGTYESHVLVGQALTIRTDVGEVSITAVHDAAFEVHYRERGVKQLPSFALAGIRKAVSVDVRERDDFVQVSTDGLVAVVEKSPLRIRFERDGKPLVAEEHGYYLHETMRGFRFALDEGEKLLGGGQRVLGMDRRGHRMPLYNKAAYGYSTEDEHQMYFGLPAVLSSDRYIIVFDNSARGWLDIGATKDDVLEFQAVAGRTAYLVVAGGDYPELIGNYTDITGRQPLPPRWAFGNFASRFGYRSGKEVRDVVRRFRRDGIPLDAIILDLYWFGPDIRGYMGDLDWDREAFPDPEKMIRDFARDGVRTITITEPFVLSTSANWQDAVDNDVLARSVAGQPRRFDFYFGNTGLIDVFDENARQWFWRFYERLFEQGIAGTWGDLGEPEVHPADALHWLSDPGYAATADEVHNAFGHAWAELVFENQVRRFPDVRPLIMMRSGFVGSQRYGMAPWTGDVSRSWGGLKPQVELSLQMGVLGLAYTHSDLGGFAGGEAFDKEMYIRWLQYGVFQPVYRPHAQEHIPSEPVFHDRETRRIVGDYIRLRYRMLPYIYTLAWENSTRGMPLMRPLFFEDESDLSLIDEKDAYLWGDAFLVVPVTDPGVDTVNIDLPAGTWFDFWNGDRYDGNATVSIDVDLETIPVLVRAGSFVPMIDDIQSTAEYSSEQLTLHYYADTSVPSATGQMYEDDGSSRLSLEQGRFELLEFRAAQDGDSLSIALQRTGGVYDGRPESRDLTLVIHNWEGDVDEGRFNGKQVKVQHDKQAKTLTVRVDWDHSSATLEINPEPVTEKAVVYQVFTRLFGNKNMTNKPWGTIEENGVGKFADFTDTALASLRDLGITHIWYTGVPHHAITTDYTAYGIGTDDPEVVKGRAGSPYAVKDYYNVNPDLAVDPTRRLEEFEELIERTHANGMKVVIDIVPNHVARRYQSISHPPGVTDFGAEDDTSVEWARDNNFYYIVGEDFELPDFPSDRYRPLGGASHPLVDGEFDESPARWSGNGARVAKPEFQDWYETVKVNHGVRPDGSYAFDRLPEEARQWTTAQHAAFWAGRDLPDSWIKYQDIVLYWTAKGVDGFRYDMAEMVPVEFWSFLNSSIKAANPDAFLFAEVYDPSLYRDYLQLGRMDYLYDKVGLYDTLKPIMRGEASTDTIAPTHADVLDIEQHMLHFLENHDEERIASTNFAGRAEIGKPAMVTSALIGSGPTMIYFAQEVGEPGDLNDAAFNQPPKMRTTQYDYWGVPHQQRWMNGGAFDGGQLTDAEKDLRDFYSRILNLSRDEVFAAGGYGPLPTDNDRLFAFARWHAGEQRIVVSNFDDEQTQQITLDVPAEFIDAWQLADGRYLLEEQLYGTTNVHLIVDGGRGSALVRLAPLESAVFDVGRQEIVRHTSFGSRYVPPRHVDVWLPAGYGETDRTYRVLYAHDGQNLFNPEWSYYTGTDWGIDETLQRLIDSGEVEDTIVVGIWNTPNRVGEYLPWEAWKVAPDYRDAISAYMRDEPVSREYLRFIVEELKPFIDANYRTRPGRDDTFLLGSSMGGLISLYGLIRYPDVFGGAACISTHWPSTMIPDNPEVNAPFLGFLRASIPAPAIHRIYFDFGTRELDAKYEPHQQQVDAVMHGLGYEPGPLWQTRKFEGAGHNEGAWNARAHIPLTFLLGTDDKED